MEDVARAGGVHEGLDLEGRELEELLAVQPYGAPLAQRHARVRRPQLRKAPARRLPVAVAEHLLGEDAADDRDVGSSQELERAVLDRAGVVDDRAARALALVGEAYRGVHVVAVDVQNFTLARHLVAEAVA